jgi:hypothetical protein
MWRIRLMYVRSGNQRPNIEDGLIRAYRMGRSEDLEAWGQH